MSVFLDFQLPSPTTWFYWSLLVAVALFFQFSRPLALRNFDLIGFYLFVPGMLLVQSPGGDRFIGYAALLTASAIWFVRCVLDNAMVQRPGYRANLNRAGLAWFGLALFAVLIGVSIRKPAVTEEQIGKSPAAIAIVKEQATAAVQQTTEEDKAVVRVAVERGLALLAHAAVCAGLFVIGRRHFRDAESGAAMATLYLLVPYTGYHVMQLHLVLPAAFIIWAVAMCNSAVWSGLLLGLASGAAFFPILLLPVWLRLHWRRDSLRFLASLGAALAVGLGLTLAVLSPDGIVKSLHLADWQPWKQPTTEGLWQGVHWAYRLPVFILFSGYIAMLFVWPPVRTLAHVAALSASILIGVQFWYAERGGLYVLWYLPLLIVMAFRPTVAELQLSGTRDRRAEHWLRAGWRSVRGRTTDTNPPALAG